MSQAGGQWASEHRRRMPLVVAGVAFLALVVGAFAANPLLGFAAAACIGLGALVAWAFSRMNVERPAADARPRNLLESEHELFREDVITGLPNRRMMLDELTREMARAERYGHDLTLTVVTIVQPDSAHTDDRFLRAVDHVAERMKRVTRTSDFLARVDGRRFAVVLQKCTSRQARIFGERSILAIGNRPLEALPGEPEPIVVGVDVTSLQWEENRFKDAADFLAQAENPATADAVRVRAAGTSADAVARDARELRRRLIADAFHAVAREDLPSDARAV